MTLKNSLRNASWALSLLVGCSIVVPLQAHNYVEKCIKSNKDDATPPPQAIPKCLSKKSDDPKPPAQQPKSLSSKKSHSKKLMAKGWFSNKPDNSTDMHKASLHAISQVFEKAKCFEIENGTSFSLPNSSSVKTVQTWQKYEGIIRILPNSSWTSSDIFIIENTVTGEAVEATPTKLPYEHSEHNRLISEINTATREIAIQQVKKLNGQTYVTTWRYEVGNSWKERDLLKQMLPGDIVIVGDNTQGFFFSTDFSFILINTNVEIESFVTAKQIGVSTTVRSN